MGLLLYSFGEKGLVFFCEVRSKNELILTVRHTILINRPVSEVIQVPIRDNKHRKKKKKKKKRNSISCVYCCKASLRECDVSNSY